MRGCRRQLINFLLSLILLITCLCLHGLKGLNLIFIVPLPRAALRLPWAIIFRPFEASSLARSARKSSSEHPTPNIELHSLGVGCWMFGVGCFCSVRFQSWAQASATHPQPLPGGERAPRGPR